MCIVTLCCCLHVCVGAYVVCVLVLCMTCRCSLQGMFVCEMGCVSVQPVCHVWTCVCMWSVHRTLWTVCACVSVVHECMDVFSLCVVCGSAHRVICVVNSCVSVACGHVSVCLWRWTCAYMYVSGLWIHVCVCPWYVGNACMCVRVLPLVSHVRLPPGQTGSAKGREEGGGFSHGEPLPQAQSLRSRWWGPG